jgi:hypothetical protein
MITTEPTLVTVTLPLARGSETPKTIRFYEADEKGKPNSKGAAQRALPPRLHNEPDALERQFRCVP